MTELFAGKNEAGKNLLMIDVGPRISSIKSGWNNEKPTTIPKPNH